MQKFKKPLIVTTLAAAFLVLAGCAHDHVPLGSAYFHDRNAWGTIQRQAGGNAEVAGLFNRSSSAGANAAIRVRNFDYTDRIRSRFYTVTPLD